jgi:hypothetical protein
VQVVAEAHPVDAAPGHPLHLLSAAGLRYGARLRGLSARALASRLYAFNTTPITATWRAALPDWRRTETWLGLDVASSWRRGLRRAYQPSPADVERHFWLHFHRRRSAAGSLWHKLYVSPRADRLPALFPRVVEACCALGVPAFKVGVGAFGALRPDKLVIYFDSREDRARAADELAAGLAGEPAQGVPFTAPAEASGLLSWGFDPGGPQGSWRQMVTERLAQALLRAPEGDVESIEAYARDDLRRAGVDPDLWRPMERAAP